MLFFVLYMIFQTDMIMKAKRTKTKNRKPIPEALIKAKTTHLFFISYVFLKMPYTKDFNHK